ncbi:MAG: glycoside hydrolase family 3 protein [Treponema sp.]|jgi:beta-N-acetylhexosaminidase|nr:glycoside hydrolase family 3 protein [Treponema sp.]
MRLTPPFLTLPLLLLLLFSGCFGRDSADRAVEVPSAAERQAAEERAAKDKIFRHIAASIAASLDDRQLAAQVIISGIDGRGHLAEDMKMLLSECPAGGIILFRYNLNTDNAAIQSLIAESAALIASGSSVPPLVVVDHEGGAVNRFRVGVADLPPAASYWEMAHNEGREAAIEQIKADSFNAGKMINVLGINTNLAPVAEYLNEDNHDFLEERSYGPDPAFTAQAAQAFIEGMELAGILCVAKHFPGSAGADPHYFPSVLRGDKAALEELAAPLVALISSGHVRALMVSHSAVPALDSAIASLSPIVMGQWLRQELGFSGIIICDDFSMAAAGGLPSHEGQSSLKPETAAVLSLAAGADMVLVWPPDLRRTHRAIVAALAAESAADDGGLTRRRLQEAAERIIFEKIRMGLINE